MKLIVGLGNPGKKYENTRHNMGFLMADYLVDKFEFSQWQEKHQGMIAKGFIQDYKTIIIKPYTFMNLSGDAVVSIAQYYKIRPSDIIILSDDLDLPFGTVRFREDGRDGGQKGLRDIFKKLGTTRIKRLKFGISNDYRSKTETSEFVLSKLSSEEQKALPKLYQEGLEKMTKNFF